MRPVRVALVARSNGRSTPSRCLRSLSNASHRRVGRDGSGLRLRRAWRKRKSLRMRSHGVFTLGSSRTNHGSDVWIFRRELTRLVKKVEQREIVTGSAAPSHSQAFGGFFSDLFECAWRIPAARPVIRIDLTQPFGQSNDSPQVFYLMIAEQIASWNDSPVPRSDHFAVNPDRQPLSEIRMDKHP